MVLSVKARVSSLLYLVANRRWLGGDGSVVRALDDQIVAAIFRSRADSILCHQRGGPGPGDGADDPIKAAKKILPRPTATHDLCCRGEEYLEPAMRIYLDSLAIIFMPDQNHRYLIRPSRRTGLRVLEITRPILGSIFGEGNFAHRLGIIIRFFKKKYR